MNIILFVTTVYNYAALILKHTSIYLLFCCIAMSSVAIRLLFEGADVLFDILIEAATYSDTGITTYPWYLFVPTFLFLHWSRLMTTIVFFILTFKVITTEDVVEQLRDTRKKIKDLYNYLMREGEAYAPQPAKIRKNLIILQENKSVQLLGGSETESSSEGGDGQGNADNGDKQHEGSGSHHHHHHQESHNEQSTENY